MGNLKLGIIGAGNICNLAHLPAYVTNSALLSVTAIFDTDRQHSEDTKAHYIRLMTEAGIEVDWEITVMNSVDALLETVDMVDICTSLKYHPFYAAMALRRNVHVMSEKPMARTWAEAQDVAVAEKQSKAFYQLNDDNIFLPRFQHFRNAVSSGAVGDITDIRISRGSHSSDRNNWFFDPIEAGGGCILDYGSHAVTASWFILGFDQIPESVRSIRIGVKERTRFIKGRLQEINVDDDAHFKVLYRNPKNGDWCSVCIEATWAYPEFGSDSSDTSGFLRICGTEGTITGCFDEDGQEYIRISKFTGGDFKFPIKSYTSESMSFADEICNFCTCINSGNRPILNAGIGALTIKTINMAQLSELRGRKAITVAEYEAFVRETAADSPIETGDRLAECLNAPHRLSKERS